MKSYTSNRLKEKLDLVLNLFHCQGSQVRQGSQCGHGPQGNLKEINVVSVFRVRNLKEMDLGVMQFWEQGAREE